jgi:hypothetical protein
MEWAEVHTQEKEQGDNQSKGPSLVCLTLGPPCREHCRSERLARPSSVYLPSVCFPNGWGFTEKGQAANVPKMHCAEALARVFKPWTQAAT